MYNPRLIALLLLLVINGCLVSLTHAADLPTKEQVIARLKHQGGLVKSFEAVVETTHAPTPKEVIPHIKNYFQRIGKPDKWKMAFYDETIADKDYASKWWRKGLHVREEKTLRALEKKDPVIQFTTVSDGKLVRTIYYTDGVPHLKGERLVGDITTVKSAHWNGMQRQNPMTLLYEDHGRPYSEIAASAKIFLIEGMNMNGHPHIRITLGSNTSRRIALYFDSEWRLIQWDEIVDKNFFEKKEMINLSVVLMDYQPHKDLSGETIWFPGRAIYNYHLGETPEGNPIVYSTNTLHIRSIRFNVNIPEEKFVLQMPKGVPIRIGRDVPASAIPEGVERYDPEKHKRPPDPNAPPKKSALLWMAIGGTGALFLLVGCVTVFYWRYPGKSAAPDSERKPESKQVGT